MYMTALNNMAKYLNETVVEFDMFAIVIGIIVLLQVAISTISSNKYVTIATDERGFNTLLSYRTIENH